MNNITKAIKPEVTLIAAMSIDGFIAPADKVSLPSTVWTSREDWQFFTKKSKELQTLIMGSKTFETIKKALPDRKIIVMTSNPERYTPYSDPNLAFTSQEVEEILADLAQNGTKQVALCGGAHIYSLFLQKKLVDRMCLTVEPYLFGDGVKLLTGKLDQGFALLNQEILNEKGTLVLQYQKV